MDTLTTEIFGKMQVLLPTAVTNKEKKSMRVILFPLLFRNFCKGSLFVKIEGGTDICRVCMSVCICLQVTNILIHITCESGTLLAEIEHFVYYLKILLYQIKHRFCFY